MNEQQESELRRWLILTQYYMPETGAPQIRLRCFIRELRRRGKDVVVATTMPNYPTGKIFAEYRGRLYRRDIVDGVPVKRVWSYAATGRAAIARIANYFSFALNVCPFILLGRRPDVIFVEGQPLPLGIVAILMKLIRGVPYVYNVPDLQVDVARELGFLRHDLLLRVASWIETTLLKHAMSVSTVTDAFIKHFEERGVPRSRISFLPNGADTDLLCPRLPEPEYVDTWQLQGKVAIVYVGTHAYYHGLDTLVNAAELLSMDSRIRFLMIGNGPERQRIRQLAVEKGLTNMVFADVPYEKTAELYSVAYASVATLRNIPVAKGMRLSKIFPSLSCGIPVIYSGIGEAGELLTRNACGIAVEPESPAALAGAIRLLANDQTMRDQLSRNGRAYVEHEFSWSTIVGRWLEALERASHSPTEASLSRASAWYPGEISDPAAESRLPASTE